MMQIVLIGIGAGLAAALLYASPTGGTSLAFPLLCVTGVPIAIAGFGWTPLAAVIASLVGAAALFAFMSSYTAVAFLLLFGFPITWCVRLALLSRTAEDGSVEWYPYGRLLLHAVGAVSAGAALYGAIIGYSAESLAPELATALQAFFAGQPNLQVPPSPEEIESFARLFVRFLPYAAGAVSILIVILDLWLGALVTRKSARLTRPEEPVWTVSLSLQAALAFVVVLALSVFPAPVGDVAAVFTGAAAGAFALIGLAVLHSITIGNSSRRFLLGGTYFLLIFFSGVPILLLAVLGLAETLFHLRARRFRGVPPTT